MLLPPFRAIAILCVAMAASQEIPDVRVAFAAVGPEVVATAANRDIPDVRVAFAAVGPEGVATAASRAIPDVGNAFAAVGPEKAGNAPPVPWAADMFHRALTNFSVRGDVGSAACRQHTLIYLSHLKNNTYWAVKMYDSWSRSPNGLLVGTTHQMGVYEECIAVHQPVQGKYCMTNIVLRTVKNRDLNLKIKEETETFDNAWDEILKFVDYQDRYRRDEVKIGICIPESCTAMDLKISLQSKLNSIFLSHQIQPQVEVEPLMCSTDKLMFPYSIGYYVTSAIMYVLFLICGLSTIYHLVVMTQNKEIDKKDHLPEFIGWFSIINNGKYLIKYDKNNELNIFNGLKFFVMIMVLFGHKFLFHTMHPMSYGDKIEKIYKIGPDILLTSMNLVDPFFFMTGYLMYVLIKPQFIKGGAKWIQVLMIVLYKYIRMLPAYGVMMLMTAYYIPYMHKGPFWMSKMWPEAENCKNYWWANLLAISNFIEVENQCLIVGWYISCLMQYLIIGSIIILICVKNRKIGICMISILLCMSLTVPFVMTYTTRSWGLVRVLLSFLKNPSSSYEFKHLYRPFYIRGIPFFTGLLAGVIIEELQKIKFKMSKLVVYIWTIIIGVICILVQNHGRVFYDRHRPYDVFEQAAYATLSHCTLTIIIFWITICHFTSGYGPIDKIVNNRFTTFFGKLSYAVYLVNIPVLMTIEYRQTTPITPTLELWFDSGLVGIVRAYLTGIGLYLFVEGPFNTIIKILFFGRKQNSKKVTENTRTASINMENVLSVSRL